MSKKEELNKEDLEFLKELFGESKKEEKSIPDFREFKDLKKETLKSSVKDGLIQFDENLVNISHARLKDSESKKIELKTSHNPQIMEDFKRSKKKKKIKKKELFLELAEVIPLIKQNNRLLNELIQHYRSIENSFKTLTQEPVKIKILK